MTTSSRLIALSLAASIAACGRPSLQPATVAADSGFVAVPGARLFYKSVGNRDPILVVHGGPGMDHEYLLPGMLGLAERHRVIFYDQRGSGRTEGEVSAATVSFDRFLSDIDAIRDSLGLRNLVLLGHSWGGLVAMRYAAKHPELRALILMNSVEPGRRYAAEVAQLLRAKQTSKDSAEVVRLSRLPGMRDRDTSVVNPLFRVMFRSTFADRTLAAQLAINLDPRTAKNMAPVATLVMGPMMSADLWAEAATIKAPTLIVQGAQDAMPLTMPRELAKAIPGAQIAIIENAGHFPYIEKPAETFAAINSFLVRVKSPAPADKKVPFAVPRRP